MTASPLARHPRLPGLGLLLALTLVWHPGADAGEVRASKTGPAAVASGQEVWPGGWQALNKTLAGNGEYQFNARFHDFDGNPVAINFDMPAAWSHEAASEFGVFQSELDAIVERCRATTGCDQAALDREMTRYLQARGVRVRHINAQHMRLSVDVPAVVARNRERVTPVAGALRDLAARHGHGHEWTLEAAMALVQGGMAYGHPAGVENGRRIIGFYPPPRALAEGYGDCDTKAALLAAILGNLTDAAIIGVKVPDHYLLGIAAEPAPGQAWITHEGRSYVLVEAAGPAVRRPGDVSDQTTYALNNQAILRIDPIY